MLKAITAEVKYGLKSLEGLMNTDGSYGVAVSQVAALFGIPIKHASQGFKKKLKVDKFQKWKSDLHPKDVNVLTLEQFNSLLFELSIGGNALAIQFSRDLQGMALYQLFCDAFGIKCDNEDRKNWFKERQLSREKRVSFTDDVKAYIDAEGIDGKKAQRIYIHVSEALNKGLFGKTAKQLCEEKEAPRNKLRDSYTSEELKMVSTVESYASCILLDGDYTPLEAMKKALAMYHKRASRS